jgi:anthranilate synthase component 2
MFLMVDNYDSFTYNIVRYIEEEGESVKVIRNDEHFSAIEISRYDGIVLSPGPSRPENSGVTLEIIEKCADMPILGVCLGMQALVYSLGGRVVSAKRIMHGKADDVTHRGGALFQGIPSTFKAVRYHSLAAERGSLPSVLEIMAESSDGEIMAVRHRQKFIWGVQFHPESYLTEHGRTIVRNFIGGAYEYRSKNNTGAR